jgi:tetratricopeptide (TPR) repeat protein
MNNNYTNSDLLVQYLDNELTHEEKLQVENELKQSAALQEELENLRVAKGAVKAYGLKQKVAVLHKEMMSEMAAIKTPAKTGIVRKIVRTSMRIAASLLIVVLGLGIYQYTTVSADKVFTENYQPYTLSVARAAEQTSAMEKSYQQKDYATVINQFVTAINPVQKENFLAGQAYLATGNYTKAAACFNKILQLNTAAKANDFNDDAEYYLALSYLKDKKISLAYPLFTSIHNNTNHLYNDKVSNSVMRQLKLLNWKQ